MKSSTSCYFKRDRALDWEKGELHSFVYTGDAPDKGTHGVVCAAIDSKTLSVPLDCLSLSEEDPKAIEVKAAKARSEAAQKLADEQAELAAIEAAHVAVAKAEAAKTEAARIHSEGEAAKALLAKHEKRHKAE